MRKFLSGEWQELRKRGLTWVLLLSCLAVTLVMAHQDRTVEQQRLLIQVLQIDSQQYFAARMNVVITQNRKRNV
ncbi:MAG: hypothetical protein AB7O65_07935, partial [Candidatus Korobacteraceae bacterium]